MTLLDVRDLRVTLDRNRKPLHVVDGVSFSVAENETLGIVGESGCGKSTTALAILRLLTRSQGWRLGGEVRFGKHDVLRMSEKDVRAMRGGDIAMILQDPMTSLNPLFTVGSQIEEALALHRNLVKEQRPTAVVDRLRLLRIPAPEDRARSYPHQLSGGMRQRVVGTIAMACRPRLLIADEPTTALDVTVQAQYLDLLRDLQREFGMAMIFITHDFGVVARMCDRVCVMYAGKVVESASVQTIFDDSAHWYTAALLGGIPKMGEQPRRLVTIEGCPPALGQLPPGCRFAPRCRNAGGKCREKEPPVARVGADHYAACWHPRGRP